MAYGFSEKKTFKVCPMWDRSKVGKTLDPQNVPFRSNVGPQQKRLWQAHRHAPGRARRVVQKRVEWMDVLVT